MLTALEIENFKGIAARQRVDFAPLTLLFGANSAGKSTVLQSLLYLQELIEHGSADVDRTELGGGVLELGGFSRLVHRHETERTIVLRAEFATPGGLERFGRDVEGFPFPDLDDEVVSAWLEVTIRFRTTANYRGPVLERAVIGVNGNTEPLVWLDVGTTLREGEPLSARVNLGHPVIAPQAREIAEDWLSLADGWDQLDSPNESLGVPKDRPLPLFAISRRLNSALPPLTEPINIVFDGKLTKRKATCLSDARTFLEMVVLGTTAQLAAFLRKAVYVGPLRTIPPRGFLFERVGRITSWADGLAAWDLLLADRLTLVERVNTWLKRLGTGCQIVVQQLFEGGAAAEEISEGHVDKTVRRLLLDTGVGSLVLPSEVGAGISQLIPIVVAAQEGQLGLSLVEQPEIHVHPAVQVGLGDLFIEALGPEGNRRRLLVETHSEHLILRLLRRIRETTAKDKLADAPVFRPDDLSVQWVEATATGTTVRKLRVDLNGEFLDPWPQGFFDERFDEVYGA